MKIYNPVWVPGDPKSYYQIIPDIFGHAFYNIIRAQTRNLQLAYKYQEILSFLSE